MELHDIVDIGVNLAHRSFQNDRKKVVARAFAAGLASEVARLKARFVIKDSHTSVRGAA